MPLLREIVSAHPSALPELPLVHTTRCEFLNAFIIAKRIEPRPCGRFSEDLIYFFYGRPAYRSSRGSKPGEPIELCPLCFVVKPAAIPAADIKRIFPCDSGAIKEGVFSPELEWSDFPELALDPMLDSARKFAQLCFGTNADYYFGRLRADLTPASSSLFGRYCALVRKAPTDEADDRRSAIEIQVGGPVTIPGQLLLVSLPRELYEDPVVRQAVVYDWGCKAVPYPTFFGDAPSAYYSVIRDRITQCLEHDGRI